MTGDVDKPTLPAADAPSFDLSKKKKKKKGKLAVADPSIADEQSTQEVAEAAAKTLASQPLEEATTVPSLDDADAQQAHDAQAQDLQQAQPLEFALPSFGGKKKKKKKKHVDFGDDPMSTADGEAGDSATAENGASEKKGFSFTPQPWDDEPGRDYSYAELINRAFQFLHGKNPALAAGATTKKRVRLELPQVAREGTKKTVFLNFGSICKSIHRQQDHLLAYMCAELGTTGNIQEGGRLVIKGRFGSEGIANVLKRYMLEYVICTSCRSPDTVLMRDANTRLYFVSCESCGAKRSVAPIRQGFMAQVEKRKK